MLKKLLAPLAVLFSAILLQGAALAGEADLIVPNFSDSPESFNYLLIGIIISAIGVVFGFWEFLKIKKLPVHKCMADVDDDGLICSMIARNEVKALVIAYVFILLPIVLVATIKLINKFLIIFFTFDSLTL